MDTVERIKQICKERKIPIYKLEKDNGFGNGYIRSLKKGGISSDRLSIIANYLNVSTTFLLTGKEEEPRDALSPLQLKAYEIISSLPPEKIQKAIDYLEYLAHQHTEEEQ